jgi:hypothetical protein
LILPLLLEAGGAASQWPKANFICCFKKYRYHLLLVPENTPLSEKCESAHLFFVNILLHTRNHGIIELNLNETEPTPPAYHLYGATICL